MSMRASCFAVLFTTSLVCCTHARAVSAQVVQSAPPHKQCQAIPAEELEEKAQTAETRTHLINKLSVLPGGADTTVEIDAVAPPKSEYCAGFLKENAPGPVVTAISITAISIAANKTWLTLRLPSPGFGRPKQRKLVLVSFLKDASGQLRLNSPGVSVTQTVWVSDGSFSFVCAVVAVVLAYLIAVLALGKIKGKHSFNPVFLTSGKLDRASLSQFQIFGFTLLVVGLLVFVLFRTSVLSDISPDILKLLGISGAGTAGSKLAGLWKKRLTFENWAWLRNQGWLKAHEQGTDQDPDPSLAQWGDLLKTDGSFDVYSFQLATVSLLVAIGLLTSDLSTLATFKIPENLLALLGLSNVVYIGGKAVAPSSFSELNDKVKALRNAEKEWIDSVSAKVAPLPDQEAKRHAAVTEAPAKYQDYLVAAREAGRMLKSLYPADGTKFKKDPIHDEELMPLSMMFEG